MRRYVIGMIAGLVGAVALSSIASADVTSLSIGAHWTPAKQDKKRHGPAKVFIETNEAHAGAFLGQPGCTAGNELSSFATPPSVQEPDHLPEGGRNRSGQPSACSPRRSRRSPRLPPGAACPRSIVGEGTSVGKTLDGRALNGVITAFKGVPSGGNPSLYLHLDIAGVATKPILNGAVRGHTLTLQIPPVQGMVSEHFDTTLNPVVTRKKRNKAMGKVEKTFLISIEVFEVAPVDDHRDDHLRERQDADG